ncbi:MAG: DUF2339 domain-containing protein [Elusimicrobia bacterium]|nr:DUF2339 domain-containing protein [Elusimicrobiota bacterium]
MTDPSPLDLKRALEELWREVSSLRSEVESLKAGRGLPGPAPARTRPPDQKPAPAARAPAKAFLLCPACEAKNDPDSAHCDQCGAPLTKPAQATAPAPGRLGRLSQPIKTEKVSDWVKSLDLSTEQFIGERLLHYVGITILAIGIGFFLVWRAAHTGPLEKVFTAAAAGAVLVGLGEWLKRRPPYDKISNGIIGGGWAILYLTAFASHHFDATRVVTSPALELGLLLLVAAGMIAHSIMIGSKALRLFSFGLTYFVLLIASEGVALPQVFLILLAASTLVAVETGHADILLVSVAGFYANFVPVWHRLISAPEASRSLHHFLGQFSWLAEGYLLLALLPLLPRAKDRLLQPESEAVLDAALSLNTVFFGVMGAGMGGTYFHTLSFKRALALSLLFDLPGLAYVFALPRKLPAPGVAGAGVPPRPGTGSGLTFTSAAPVVGLLILAGGIFNMPSPMTKMLVWMAAAGVWTWIGLLLDHKSWRVSGLVMAVLTFGLYFSVARVSHDQRHAASAALFYFSAASYLASRWYRLWLKGEVPDWEKPAMEYWLYVGSTALVLGLWGVLDPAPFAIALIALAVAGEHLAVFFGRVHLWGQASFLALAAGAYTFFVDFGANLAVAGPLTPRLLTSGCVVAGMAYLYYGEPVEKEFTRPWKAWTIEGNRAWLSWGMTAVAAFAVYNEFDPRMRLPAWAGMAFLLYLLGSSREEDSLKKQAVLLAAATGVEGAVSYLLQPKALLAEPTAANIAIYWGSALSLLLNLSLSKDARRKLTETDRQASWAFCCLSMAMAALYLSKELQSYHLTLALSFEGIIALLFGMALGYAELRYPALLLLGLCVFKAMAHDSSMLPLPQRVATMIVLGVILLGASMLYVRMGKRDEKDPPDRAP